MSTTVYLCKNRACENYDERTQDNQRTCPKCGSQREAVILKQHVDMSRFTKGLKVQESDIERRL